MLDLTHDSIFVRDMDFVITYWNRGAEEFYGWTPRVAVGRRSDEFLHPPLPKLVAIRAQLLKTEPPTVEMRSSNSGRTVRT